MKRKVLLWIVYMVSRWDRLEFILGMLAIMGEEQRKLILGKIWTEYYPGTHPHKNPRRKVA